MAKMKRAAPPVQNRLSSGAIQKQGGAAPQAAGGTPAVYHGNSRLPLHPALQRALKMKSQGSNQKD